MKQVIIVVFLFLNQLGFAQQEYHVFPSDHHSTPGSKEGNGSLNKPWDLHTALNQPSSTVNGGDFIWLHEGIYNGRFLSNLSCTNPNSVITVASYKIDKVVLNGNVNSSLKAVLEVRGQRVVYKNFEVTFLGEYARHVNDNGFQRTDGINHMSGEECQFINLKIYDNPGSGFGSWKITGGTTIYGCQIYNNGFFSEVRGRGAGIYIQNISDKAKKIINNTIFNNYYMGIEVWSAGKKAKASFVKNMLLQNNVVFNNGSSGNQFKNNLIIATDDRLGVNRATNIKVYDNVFYHNVEAAVNAKGDAGSVMLGKNKFSPLKNVELKRNIIIGGNNALRIHSADALVFEDNVIYGGYVHISNNARHHIDSWQFNGNNYFSKNRRNFRIVDYKDYTFEAWKTQFSHDSKSTWKNLKHFNSNEVLQINQNEYNTSHYRVTLFQIDGLDVAVDFSEYNIEKGREYRIYDVENPNVEIKKGAMTTEGVILFPMHLETFEKPSHNTYAQKTPSSFGVFKIEFDAVKIDLKKRDNLFKRFFNWLGF